MATWANPYSLKPRNQWKQTGLIIGLRGDSGLNIFEKYRSIGAIWDIWCQFFCYFSKGGTDFSEKRTLLSAGVDCSLSSVIHPSVQQLSCPRKLNSYLVLPPTQVNSSEKLSFSSPKAKSRRDHFHNLFKPQQTRTTPSSRTAGQKQCCPLQLRIHTTCIQRSPSPKLLGLSSWVFLCRASQIHPSVPNSCVLR